MALDPRGIISAVELVFYIPTAILVLILTLRHGFRRDAGWIFLLIFSLIRIVGAAIFLGADASHSTSTNAYVAALILESAGLSPLMLATLSFLAVVIQNASPDVPFQRPALFRLLRLTVTVALVIAIVGGTQSSNSNSGTVNTGNSLRKASGIIFICLYGIIASMHFVYWIHKNSILRYRRTLLIGISTALPFLGVRALYSVLSSFSPTNFSGSSPTQGLQPVNSNGLSKFNIVSGEWQIYLGMSLIMEFAVVMIYCVVGTRLPLRWEEDQEMLPIKPDGIPVSASQRPLYGP